MFYRNRMGWTQDELAERVGTTRSIIGKLERGERRISANWRARFAAAFGLAPDDLQDSETGLGELPTDERELVMRYRLMSAQQREAVQSLVKALREP